MATKQIMKKVIAPSAVFKKRVVKAQDGTVLPMANGMQQVESQGNIHAEIISVLFHAHTQTKVFHLQTRSFAAHLALGDFYDAIIDLTDSLVESLQGKHQELIVGYQTYELMNYVPETSVEFFLAIRDQLAEYRMQVEADCPEIANLVDEITTLINSTVYKLTFLK